MQALVKATREVLAQSGLRGEDVIAFAIDTTGSSVVIVDEARNLLMNTTYGAIIALIVKLRRLRRRRTRPELEAIEWCGGVYSHEWGWAKLLHWLRHASEEKRARFATALEHCDMVAATLTGVTDPSELKRSCLCHGA